MNELNPLFQLDLLLLVLLPHQHDLLLEFCFVLDFFFLHSLHLVDEHLVLAEEEVLLLLPLLILHFDLFVLFLLLRLDLLQPQELPILGFLVLLQQLDLPHQPLVLLLLDLALLPLLTHLGADTLHLSSHGFLLLLHLLPDLLVLALLFLLLPHEQLFLLLLLLDDFADPLPLPLQLLLLALIQLLDLISKLTYLLLLL